MDEGGGLEGLAGPLRREFPRRQPAKLVIDEGQELLGRLGVTLLDGREDARDVVHRGARPTTPAR